MESEDGDLSCEEDFSEIPIFAEEDEPQASKPIQTEENNCFEVLSVEKMVENIYDMVANVQNFISVSNLES